MPSLSQILDWAVFEAGPYLLALWTLTFTVVFALALRGEWRRAHIVSADRIDAVREWTGDHRIYVPEDWDRKPVR